MNKKKYRVSLSEEPGDKHTVVFDCWATDADDAAAQAEAEYPGCVVKLACEFDD